MESCSSVLSLEPADQDESYETERATQKCGFKSAGKRLEAATRQSQWKLGTDESAGGLQARRDSA